MATYANGRVIAIDIDYGSKCNTENKSRRDLTKACEITKVQPNIFFMTRKQLCKHLHIK